MECLAPIPQTNFDRTVWVQGLICLLMVPGWYWYLLEWASAAPLKNGPVIWIGQFDNQATMTNIVAYITANSVTVHNADDAVIWAQTATQEMVVQIKDSRGFSNSSTSTIYKPIRQELKVTCSNDSLNCTWGGISTRPCHWVNQWRRWPPLQWAWRLTWRLKLSNSLAKPWSLTT